MPTIAAFVRDWLAEPRPTFELRAPSARWAGSRPREARSSLRVVDVVRETPTTRTFVLEPAGGMPALTYRAGQHLTLLVDVAGTTQRRCYSFSTSPLAHARPAITVKRMPEGIVSRHLHDRVRTGDTLVALGPSGSFTLEAARSAARRLVLVAGGVGITPLASLAETALRAEPRSRVLLVCGNRCEAEIIFRHRLAALEAESGGRLRVVHALDAPPAGWAGLSGPLDGARTLEALGDTVADAYYVCGPEQMMRGVCEALASAGVPQDCVHTERFAYASPTTTRIPDHPARITFAASGRHVVARTGQTLLQAGLAAGVDLPFSCTMGGCGACKVRTSGGTVVMSEPNCLSDAEREGGLVLACCAYADTDVVIEDR